YDTYNASQQVTPIYPINWPLLASVPEPAVVRLIAQLTAEGRSRAAWARRCSRWLWPYSVTSKYLWKWRDRRLGSAIGKFQSEIVDYKARSTYQSLGPGNMLPSKEATYDELVATWKRCSLQLHRLCQANGITYYHFLQPNQYVAGSKPMGSEERLV